jgi:23S rRNA pseudouridine1911/1915/1917 synthase
VQEASSRTIEILYEDNHLIGVYKPHGMLTQGDATGDTSLLDETKAFIKQRDKKPGAVFLGLLHRLDRPAAGVVLFGKTSKGASRLSEQFRTREVRKIYRALVCGEPKKHADTLIHYLDEEAHEDPGGDRKRAELNYRVLKAGKKMSLLEIEIKTGRKHQIRLQMSAIGHPLVGDSRYGSKIPFQSGAIALNASSLEFSHPIRQEERIVLELPEKLSTLKMA